MVITVNGRPVDSEEWLAWREQGMQVRDIARMLGVTPSREPGPLFILDPVTDDGAYVLGILWGLLSTTEDGYWVGHEDKWYIDTVQEHLGIEGIYHLLQQTMDAQVLRLEPSVQEQTA